MIFRVFGNVFAAFMASTGRDAIYMDWTRDMRSSPKKTLKTMVFGLKVLRAAHQATPEAQNWTARGGDMIKKKK